LKIRYFEGVRDHVDDMCQVYWDLQFIILIRWIRHSRAWEIVFKSLGNCSLLNRVDCDGCS